MEPMSDSDDDYMSDKILSGCVKDDVRPGLFVSRSQKRKHEIYKKQLQVLVKKPKSYREQEKEMRDKGLSTAISSENKGFKLLEKMGYKAGTSLGKTVKGMVEPVAIETKNDTSGVGQSKHIEEVVEKKKNLKEWSLQAKEREFLLSNAERHNMVTLQKDYMKAQKICEELDFKTGIQSPVLPFFWTKNTRNQLNEKNEEATSDVEDSSDEEELEEISESKLADIIMHLRGKYSYCIYCGAYVEEDLSCPGYFRKNHDD